MTDFQVSVFQVSLSITSGNIDNSFTINATGYITTTKSLDRETTASYTLKVQIMRQLSKIFIYC